MAGVEGWSPAQLRFCEDVAAGMSEYDAYARNYSTGPGWRANARAMLKRSKIAERIATLRQRAGLVIAAPSVEDLAALDDAERQHLADITAELERTQAPGARVKLLKLRSELLKRKRKRPENKGITAPAIPAALPGRRRRNPEIAAYVDRLYAESGAKSWLQFFEMKFPLSPRDHARLKAEEDWLGEHCPNIAALTQKP